MTLLISKIFSKDRINGNNCIESPIPPPELYMSSFFIIYQLYNLLKRCYKLKKAFLWKSKALVVKWVDTKDLKFYKLI